MQSSTYHSIDHDCLVAGIKVAAIWTGDASIMTRVIILILPLLGNQYVTKVSIKLCEEHIGDLFIGQVLAPRIDRLWKEDCGKDDVGLSSDGKSSSTPRQG